MTVPTPPAVSDAMQWQAPVVTERWPRPIFRREVALRPAHRRYLTKILSAGPSTAGQIGMDRSTAQEMCREGLLSAEPRQWGKRMTTAYAITPAGQKALTYPEQWQP